MEDNSYDNYGRGVDECRQIHYLSIQNAIWSICLNYPESIE